MGDPIDLRLLTEWLRSPSAEERENGVAILSDLVADAYGEEGASLGEAIRQVNALPLLSFLTIDPSPIIQRGALSVLGNLCSDAFDPQSAQTKHMLLECGAATPLFRVMMSDDDDVLLFAC
eukprot:3953311-Prymnesium_polylepis.1